MLQSYAALPHSEDAGILTTLDLTQRSNVVLLQNALAGDSVSLWDVQPDRIIRVNDMVAHYSHYISEETGEEVSGPMLTLIGPDGIYHTGSEYAFRGMQMIAYAHGRPPWRPPVSIRAIRCRSRKQREYQSIILVE